MQRILLGQQEFRLNAVDYIRYMGAETKPKERRIHEAGTYGPEGIGNMGLHAQVGQGNSKQ